MLGIKSMSSCFRLETLIKSDVQKRKGGFCIFLKVDSILIFVLETVLFHFAQKTLTQSSPHLSVTHITVEML